MKIRDRIALLPAVAGVGMLGILMVTVVLGQKTQRELRLIESGYSPSLELSRTLETQLASLQRTLQDAVAASNPDAIADADGIAEDFRRHVAAGRSNEAANPADLDKLERDLNSYYDIARRASVSMISGDMGGDMLSSLEQMRDRYNALRESLTARTEADQGKVDSAFAGARARQQLTTWIVIGILLSMGAILAALSVGTIRGVTAALGRITYAADRIADGEIDQTVDYHGRDEIGAVADAFRRMIGYIGDVAAAADGLARGQLDSTLTPRSDSDVLAQNMVRATKSLQRLERETRTLIDASVAGSLEVRASADGLEGAYRDLIDGMNTLFDTVAAPLAEAAEVLVRVADRDLTLRMTGDYQGEFRRVKEALNGAVVNLEQTLSQVSTGATQVAAASQEISAGAQSLAEGSSEQASSLEEVGAALQEMASMTQRNANHSREGRALADTARQAAERGVESMRRLSAAVERIRSDADQTARIVRTIDEIAFQTNLLALNAAVEAARAGDAGKGFAVVAEEVRALAMRSAEAARNTAELIDQSVTNAESGVAMNGEVLTNLDEIQVQVARVADVIAEIATASVQQTNGVAEITASMERINDVTQGVAAKSEESASAAEELSSQAGHMLGLVGEFTLTSSATESYGRAEPRTPGLARPVKRPRRMSPSMV